MAFLVGLPFFALASITNGTIDGTYKYGWSNNIGVINFAPTGNGETYQGLVITDSSVTGHAWSGVYGWINFGPFFNNSGGGVSNTAQGVLLGYAWGQNLGWINFSGVVINSLGQFTGTASGDIVGTINFDFIQCTGCGVKTDWRPVSARPTSGGGGLPAVVYMPPIAPASGFSILINNGQTHTDNPSVTLQLNAGSDVKKMAISESPNFESASQEDYQPTKIWNLSAGDSIKTIYVKFYTQYGQPSQVISNSIILGNKVVENNTTNNLSVEVNNSTPLSSNSTLPLQDGAISNVSNDNGKNQIDNQTNNQIDNQVQNQTSNQLNLLLVKIKIYFERIFIFGINIVSQINQGVKLFFNFLWQFIK